MKKKVIEKRSRMRMRKWKLKKKMSSRVFEQWPPATEEVMVVVVVMKVVMKVVMR